MERLYKLLSGSVGLIITDLNRFYLTGFDSSLGYLFLVSGRKILYVDGRYIEAAKKEADKDCEIRLLNKLGDAVAEIRNEYKTDKILLETEITVKQAQMLKNIGGGFCEPCGELSDILSELRSIKSEKEKENTNCAQRIAEKAFLNALGYIKCGISEKEIALRLEYDMQSLGSVGVAFETIVVSGKNSSRPHGVPSSKKVENGDFITMDFGAKWGGYCSDMTRTVAVGYVSEEMEKVYNTVLRAQEAGISAIGAGVRCKDVDLKTRKVIEDSGYGKYFTHSTGHGVGLYIHEQPNVSYSSESILKEGNIITCEPGIYIEDKFGVRIEDMLYVKKTGAENLTKSQKNLIIIK